MIWHSIRPAIVGSALALLGGAVALQAPASARPVAAGHGPGCFLGAPAATLVREGDQAAAGGRLLVRWDLPADPALDGHADPDGPGYRKFMAALRQRRVATDARRALRRSLIVNNRIVLEHARDWIRPATCLEKYLYGLQHERIPTIVEPTEFSAFVLSSADGATVRVYWYSVNRNGIGNASPLTDPVRADVGAGWRVRYVLHSHPFKPSDDTLNGIVAPSAPDAFFQLNMRTAIGLPEARITNGVDTVRIPSSAFDEFETE